MYCYIASYMYILCTQREAQPIHSAAISGHTDVISVLVEKYGVDPQEEANVRMYICMHAPNVLHTVTSHIGISVYINKIMHR